MGILTDVFVLKGGLDTVTPYYLIEPGKLLAGINYECLPEGGYQRIKGYQLYDGHTSRASVLPVPGNGPVRGVFILRGSRYAIRNNSGDTAAVLYKATTAGWVAQSLGSYLKYTAATQDFVEGDVVTGATSAASATVRRLVVNSGSSGSGTAAGLVVLTGITGTFVNGEILKVGATNYAVASGVVTAATLPPNGKYDVVIKNFRGRTSDARAYCVNGVGWAFEWDGTYLAFFDAGTSTKYPVCIEEHKGSLVLGYAEGSIVLSSTGEPLQYNAITGAAEIAVGDSVNDLHAATGGVLVVGSENRVNVLYGNDVNTWNLQEYTRHGVRPFTMQEMANNLLALDNRGVQNLKATAAYGDFEALSVSRPINKELVETTSVLSATASTVNRNRTQYRLFYGRTGYYFTYAGTDMIGIGKVVLADSVNVAFNGEDASGNEVTLFGSDNGKVFQMDTTNFFDGTPIPAILRLAYNFQKRTSQKKQYRRMFLDFKSFGTTVSLQIAADFEFGNTETPATRTILAVINSIIAGTWGVSLWSGFEWTSMTAEEPSIYLDGVGRSIGLIIASNGAEDATHAIYGITLHYSLRRVQR